MDKRGSLLTRLFGDSVKVRILQTLLEGKKMDISLNTLSEEAEVSKSRTYEIIEDLEKKKIVMPTRKIRNKQLYALNYKNKTVKILDSLFLSLIKVCKI